MKNLFIYLVIISIYSCKNETIELSTVISSSGGSFPGPSRNTSSSFTIGDKGYIVTGAKDYYDLDGPPTLYNDLWEFDSNTGLWTKKANLPGAPRKDAIAFSIGFKGYVGTGRDSNYIYKDFWEYDPLENKWTQKADYGGGEVYGAVAFSISNKGYVGLSYNTYYNKNLWEYDPVEGRWSQKADYIGNDSICKFYGFVVNNNGIVITSSYNHPSQIYMYDPTKNKWTINGTGFSGVTLSVNNTIYGFGTCQGIFEYTQNKWIKIRNYFDPCDHHQILHIETMSYFVIDNKVYFTNGCSKLMPQYFKMMRIYAFTN
jgi:N-acetylneuraminic acid mutarotase